MHMRVVSAFSYFNYTQYSTRLTVVGATVFYLWDMSEWLLDTAWFLKTNRLDSPVHK